MEGMKNKKMRILYQDKLDMHEYMKNGDLGGALGGRELPGVQQVCHQACTLSPP